MNYHVVHKRKKIPEFSGIFIYTMYGGEGGI